MATTDAKAGFRLPWSSDRSATDETDNENQQNAEATAEPTAEPTDQATVDGWPTAEAETQHVTEPTEATEASQAAQGEASVDVDYAGVADAEPVTAEPSPRYPSGRKPSKFLADLTRAMQTAAEESRALALSQLQGEAKSHIEQIHARSSTEAADLRRAADDDVAAVREWSKSEIARIREETETKISGRKARLETEIEHHAAVIEREIEAVQSTVAGFEADMATFFERLLAEEDPTQFATMAERLPEPPTFSSILVARDPEPETTTFGDTDEPVESEWSEPSAEAEAESVEATASTEEAPSAVANLENEITETSEVEAESPSEHESANGYVSVDTIGEGSLGEFGSFEGMEGEDGEVDREAAFAAIQAAAEAAASAEVAADAAARAEAVADVAIEIIGSHGEDDDADPEADPRVAALGLSPDYDAAEAEALASADANDGEEIPEIGDDALAARLAGLVPNRGSKANTDATATQVVVVGLVSVASIASFKRHLGRLPGVQSVGVSSGPDGEFIFAVNHTADVLLREAVPSMPSFQARVTGTSDGVVNVTAHDPESDS
jgi:hypothetical protein